MFRQQSVREGEKREIERQRDRSRERGRGALKKKKGGKGERVPTQMETLKERKR